MTSSTHLARTEPVFYFPYLLILLFLQALLRPNPRAHNQGLGLLHGPHLAWGPQLFLRPTALQGHMPSSFLECWLPLLPAWALSRFLLPLPCLSQAPLFEGQGGHGGARHPITRGSVCVWGYGQSEVGQPDTLMGKVSLDGGIVGALSQGTLQLPSLCEEQLVEARQDSRGVSPEAHTRCFRCPVLV